MVHDLQCCIRNTSGITGITYHIIVWSITMYSCRDSGVVLEYLPVNSWIFLRVPGIAVPVFLHSGKSAGLVETSDSEEQLHVLFF